MALQKLNAQILEGGLTFDTDGNMTLTGNLYATDVGNDDDPIEDFYVSDESIWIGDEHKLQVSSTGKMKFRKRKVTTVPAVITAAGGTSAGALTHSGKASLNQLKKKHWRLYARSLGGSLANAKNKDIFRDNKVDYQEESDASAWQVNDVGETYASVNVGIGNTNPASSLHISGTDSLILPAGTVAERGTATQGGFRFNTETPGFEGYDGAEWGAIGGGASSELTTDTTKELKGSYIESLLLSDVFTLGGDITLTDNLFLAKLSDDGTDITLTDDGTSRTITGQGTLVPGALFDNSFAIATASQPNIEQIGTTGSIKIPTGTTAQRGTALAGGIRYNTTLASFEGYSGSAWGSLGGLIDVDQDTYVTAEATPDSDDLDFWTDGTKRMTIDSSGDVNISGDIKLDNGWGNHIGLSDMDVGIKFVDNGSNDTDMVFCQYDGTDRDFRWCGTTDGGTTLTTKMQLNNNGELFVLDGISIGIPTSSTYCALHVTNTVVNGLIMHVDGPGGSAFTVFDPGKVAIGKHTPTSELDVDGVITATGGTSTNWNTAYGWGDHSGAGYATLNSQWTTTGNDIYYNTGKVGIGATSPSSPLHLKTTGSTDVNMVLEGPNSTWSIGNDYSNAGYLKISNHATVGTSTAMTFAANGLVGIGTDSPDRNLHIKANASTGNEVALTLENDAQKFKIGVFDFGSGNDQLFIHCHQAGTDALVMDGAGNVGIGTTSPGSYKLNVNGNFYASTINGQEITIFPAGATNNLGIGVDVLDALTTGDRNISLGDYSLSACTNGYDNIAIGTYALNSMIGSTENVAIGRDSLKLLTGYQTTAVGYRTGHNITTGNNNVLIGAWAGDNITTGSNNVMIGFDIQAPSATGSNQLNFCDAIYGDLSTGFIGIGETIPQHPLHVKRTGANLHIRMEADDNRSNSIEFKNVSNQYVYCGMFGDASGGAGKFGVYNQGLRMVVDTSGNVGIGTTSPGSYKLNVNGDIYCNDLTTADIIMSNDRPDHPGNEIDGTKGSWVFQEGIESMYLINKKSGKRYKIMLDEV